MVVNSGSKCNLLLGIYHPFHLCFHVIVLHMSVSIQGDANVRVSHQILQSFGIHTAFGHVGTKRMSANMRCDVRQLFPIELVVARTDVIEVVFPVHCNGWVSVLVKKEKTAFTVNHRLVLGTRPIFNNAPEAHMHMEISAPDGSCLYVGNGKGVTEFTVNISESGTYSITVRSGDVHRVQHYLRTERDT